MDTEDTKPWDRQRDSDDNLEPNLWYDRFTRFRLLGPDRSLLAIYNEWQDTKGRKRTRTPATSWRKACDKWQWRKRAEAWDEAERERINAEYEAERLEWREKRRQLLQGFFAQLAKALRQFEPEGASLGQITQAVRTAAQELRAEYDDLPTEKQKGSLLNIDVTRLTNEQLERIASGEDPVVVLATSGKGRN